MTIPQHKLVVSFLKALAQARGDCIGWDTQRIHKDFDVQVDTWYFEGRTSMKFSYSPKGTELCINPFFDWHKAHIVDIRTLEELKENKETIHRILDAFNPL